MWSRPEIVKRTRGFVPAADEVWRLQTDPDPECELFRKIVRGSTEPSRGSLQGTYVIAAGGILLGRINSRNPEQVGRMLDRALAKFAVLPDAHKRLTEGATSAPRHRWEDSYPKGGLVLVRTVRDLRPDRKPSAPAERAFNRDAVWFSTEEARQIVPTNDAFVHFVPGHLAERLARLHLVDNVRGQTLPFAADEVTDVSLVASHAGEAGDSVTITLRGDTVAKAAGPWLLGENYWKPKREWPRQIKTKLLGKAVFDRKRGVFTQFTLVALAEFEGRTAFNGRRGADPRGAVGFLFELAAPDWRVAPTFINLYDVDWVTEPDR